MRKTTGAITLASMAIVLFASVPAAASTASDESDFLRMLNRRRADKGKRALVMRSDLTTIARRHSGRMAAEGDIFHNPRLSREVKGEREAGENVGVGPDPASLDQAFYESSGHRANILWSGYNEVGVGVVRTEYELYVTFVFVDRPAPKTTEPAPDADEQDKPATKSKGSTGGSSKQDQAATAQRGERQGGSRGTPVPVREPERSVDLLMRTVALDAA